MKESQQGSKLLLLLWKSTCSDEGPDASVHRKTVPAFGKEKLLLCLSGGIDFCMQDQ